METLYPIELIELKEKDLLEEQRKVRITLAQEALLSFSNEVFNELTKTSNLCKKQWPSRTGRDLMDNINETAELIEDLDNIMNGTNFKEHPFDLVNQFLEDPSDFGKTDDNEDQLFGYIETMKEELRDLKIAKEVAVKASGYLTIIFDKINLGIGKILTDIDERGLHIEEAMD